MWYVYNICMYIYIIKSYDGKMAKNMMLMIPQSSLWEV